MDQYTIWNTSKKIDTNYFIVKEHIKQQIYNI